MPRNTFHDPAGGLADYTWDVGHHDEKSSGRDLAVTNSSNVAGTRLIAAQGEPSPIVLSFAGAILKRSQLVEMWRWFALCSEAPQQTIHFTDFAGDTAEVLITNFQPVRVAGRNLRGGAEAPLWYWTYQLDMTVIQLITGPMAEVGIRA